MEPYVRKMNGGGTFYLPEVKAVHVIREAFRSPLDGNTNKDLLFDAATSAIKVLERNLAKARELGIFDNVPSIAGQKYNIKVAKEGSFERGQFLLAHPLLSFSLNRGILIILKVSFLSPLPFYLLDVLRCLARGGGWNSGSDGESENETEGCIMQLL